MRTEECWPEEIRVEVVAAKEFTGILIERFIAPLVFKIYKFTYYKRQEYDMAIAYDT